MTSRVRVVVVVMIVAMFAVFATPTLAAKRGGGGGGGGSTSGGASHLTLILVNSTDGLAHWGQQITFSISTTATSEPHVSVICYQGGSLVYSAQSGYFAGYPWPWTQVMTLSSSLWTGGAADCTATLYSLSGSRSTTLATMSFHVYA
jgi:hypothetical protein